MAHIVVSLPFWHALCIFLCNGNTKQQSIMQKGNIGVTTENIFPVIKKFLYSDNEIFLREMVSNAVDATQKMKTLASQGEFKGDLGDLTVRVAMDEKAGTITISDRGIGMTADEIDRYINQIAFSGVNDFLEKYKDNAAGIIGHFGLGFYSAFMVAKRVEIITRSWQEGAKAVRWTCDGTPEYQIEDAEKAGRGSDIILHIDDDCKEYLDKQKLQALLTKYCKFLAVPVAFGKKTEWKDGKDVETDKDNIINDSEPLWTKTPSTLTDDDYKKFYRTLYPMSDEPLFWIHLNVDYPFNLTGILYFPRIKSNIDLQLGKIQLYCNQVFVTDQVEGIVPQFLTLLHGVIDSPDIPLNVSRSYLQSDRDVKKIATYITKKVADRLQAIFKDDRAEYEKKWDDLKLFINYGMLSDESFYDRAKDFALFKDTEGKHFTFEEYSALVKEAQTDKEGKAIYLYATNADDQWSYIQAAKDKGYSVLMMDGQLDVPSIGLLEQKLADVRFARVDSDTIDRLIAKDDAKKDEGDNSAVCTVFRSSLPKLDKAEIYVEAQAMGEDALPVQLTQSEYMRRMKDMSRFQQGMGFYAQMPDSYNLVLNTDNALVKKVIEGMAQATEKELAPIKAEQRGLEARLAAIQQGKKPEELSDEEKKDKADTEEKLSQQQAKEAEVLAAYGKSCNIVGQLIDLALLRSGMLKGEALDRFLKRSMEMMGN